MRTTTWVGFQAAGGRGLAEARHVCRLSRATATATLARFAHIGCRRSARRYLASCRLHAPAHRVPSRGVERLAFILFELRVGSSSAARQGRGDAHSVRPSPLTRPVLRLYCMANVRPVGLRSYRETRGDMVTDIGRRGAASGSAAQLSPARWFQGLGPGRENRNPIGARWSWMEGLHR